MPQFIGIIIFLIILYHVIVYLVLPVLGIGVAALVAVVAIVGILGIVWGFGLSCYNFVRACSENIFERTTDNNDNACESFFYWKGDWWNNLIGICEASWKYNANAAEEFGYQAKRSNIIQSIFCYAAVIVVWIGTFLFLPLLFTIFGSLFLLVFVTYNLLAFGFYSIESVYLQIHGVFILCPVCSHRVILPRYICPSCGKEHDCLMPTARYGALYQTCNGIVPGSYSNQRCGYRLPTSRFTGRNKLDALCSHCKVPLSGEYRPMTVAFLGGRSVGKIMVHIAISCDVKRIFGKHGWSCTPADTDDQNIINNMEQRIRQGARPPATQDTGNVKALCINLKDSYWKFPRRLYLYDPPGEIFKKGDKLHEQNYYKFLRAAVIVIDPFSLPQVAQNFSSELNDNVKRQNIAPSLVSPKESFEHWLISMKHHGGLTDKNVLCAIVINKTDVPGLQLVPGASDQECRRFLESYDLRNLMEQVKKNFKECRYFAISTTGGSKPGVPFQPQGIEQVMDWLFTHDCFK